MQNQLSLETSLIQQICSKVPVERIYLLGTEGTAATLNSIFATVGCTQNQISHYFLLILVDKATTRHLHEIQDKIENTCRIYLPVTALVLYEQDFNTLLSNGNRFACTVNASSRLLYARHPFTPVSVLEVVANSQEIWTKEYNQISELLRGARFYQDRKQVQMALFMAHHAAVAMLHYLFKKTTGLYLQIQNFDKLLRYSSMISSEVLNYFPKNTDGEKRLYHLLQHTSIQRNSNNKYKAVYKDVELILGRIDKARELLL